MDATSRASLRSRLRSLAMGGVFLVYPTICNTLFATFECRTLTTAQDSLTEGVLEQDDRLLCSDGAMASLRWLSAVAIVGFAVGVPLTFAVVLRRAAREYDTSEQRQLDLIFKQLLACMTAEQAAAALQESLLPSLHHHTPPPPPAPDHLPPPPPPPRHITSMLLYKSSSES